MSLAICDTCLGTGADEGAPCMDCAETGHGWDWDDEEDDMPEPLIIVVPWDPNRTSLNQRLHWAERVRRNSQAKLAAWAGWEEAGRPHLAVPVDVEIVVKRGRVIDTDNALTGLKPAIDFLFTEDRVTPDDSQQWVRFTGIRVESAKEFRDRPEVEFRISERGEP